MNDLNQIHAVVVSSVPLPHASHQRCLAPERPRRVEGRRGLANSQPGPGGEGLISAPGRANLLQPAGSANVPNGAGAAGPSTRREVRSVIGWKTLAGRRGNAEEAPISAVAMKRP